MDERLISQVGTYRGPTFFTRLNRQIRQLKSANFLAWISGNPTSMKREVLLRRGRARVGCRRQTRGLDRLEGPPASGTSHWKVRIFHRKRLIVLSSLNV